MPNIGPPPCARIIRAIASPPVISLADIRSAPARTPSTRAESALYAVLSGKIEVVKRFDGVERPLGVRLPGTIFGEVPLASCHGFPWWLPRGVPLRVIQPATKDPAYR